MSFRVKRFFERVGNGYAFYYQPGAVIDASCLDHERLVRDGFLEVFGEEAVERKATMAEAEAVERKPGRPRKVALA